MCAGSRSFARQTALTKNVRESTPSAQPAPTPATRPAEIAGPAIPEADIERPRRAFASCNRSGLTTCGVSPVAAGLKNADAIPWTGLQRGDLPDLGVAGDQQDGSCTLRPETDQVGGDHHRPPRQAIGEHPADQEEADGTDRPGREDVTEISGAPVRSRIANARATGVIESPSCDTTWPVKSKRKSRSWRTPRFGLRITSTYRRRDLD